MVAIGVFVMASFALKNEFFESLNHNVNVFVLLIATATFILIAAAAGVTASYARNHCMTFLVLQFDGD